MSVRRPLLYLHFTGNYRSFRRQWYDGPLTSAKEWIDIVFTENTVSPCNITMAGFEFEDTGVTGCLSLLYASSQWSSNWYHCLERYWFHSLAPHKYCLTSVIFQKDDARPQVARNVQEFFFIHHIELLRWHACSPDISPIGNLWSMLVQHLVQDTLPAATPVQFWHNMWTPYGLLHSKDTSIASLFLCRGLWQPLNPTIAAKLNTDFVVIHT
ncbi:transposable element Tc3 transposase [Trichonephila clavipes]|uniref:Transposable element Tc3 transposase n=1 Tax=Trichonephila clavipes TaxID=2585209 RepID=A0A8X6RP89_TRICX|nr:transposable element Tc3 transposase [Trichonephila clavipes]